MPTSKLVESALLSFVIQCLMFNNLVGDWEDFRALCLACMHP